MVEVTVLGISMQEDNGAPLILLHPRGTEKILVMRVGPVEAFAVSTALPEPSAKNEGGRKESTGTEGLFPRPQVHDLLLRVINALRGTLRSIDILNHIDGVFIAEAVIDHPGGRSRIDCRPADGIALALRCGAPIQASSAVLAFAGNINAVMATLPEYVRAIAAAKLAQIAGAEHVPGRLPPALENALAARTKTINEDTRRELLSVARQMLENENTPDQRSPGIAPPQQTAPKVKVAAPQIRVSLMRQKKNGDAELLEEYLIPTKGLPKDVVASLGLSGRDAAAVSAASDEERWAMLLQMLAPETKVLM
ncbi:bifunctional nuclease family protein [Desulfovibrio sp. OttesenSCG-928-F20]|nr:bifunctional nuclease family protein [Desulfovibrio sp. OttesenSCG-928-F20]